MESGLNAEYDAIRRIKSACKVGTQYAKACADAVNEVMFLIEAE